MDVVTKQKLAYNFLRDRILSGELLPGQRIIAGHIANEIGTSGIPVREALLQLQADGLVEITPHVGAIVTTASIEEVISTMETTAILEGYATRLSLPRGSEVIHKLKSINDAMAQAGQHNHWSDFGKHNRDFHSTIYSVCPNDVLIESIKMLWEKHDSLRSRTVFFQIPTRAKQSVREHQQIIAMLANQHSDPLKLELLAREHKFSTLRALEANLPKESALHAYSHPHQ